MARNYGVKVRQQSILLIRKLILSSLGAIR